MSDRKLTVDQLITELKRYNHRELHVHHTWRPNHASFTGLNHQALQNGMRNFHVKSRRFADIAQHVSLYPDGLFLTGRDFGKNPASILGHNHGLPFCVEMVGNFDKGNDTFGGLQKAAMLKLAKYFDDCDKYVRFHNENAAKSCPGTSIVKSVFMSEVKGYVDGVIVVEAPATEVKSEIITRPSAPKPIAPSYDSTLGKGRNNRKSDVITLQKDLIAKGFSLPRYGADGDYGTETEEAVKSFQRKVGVTIDGLVGPVTLAKLAAYSKPSYALPDGVFRTGANNRSGSVIVIQRALNEVIGAGLVVDGVYGVKSADAVRKFQRKYGLVADGIYGPNTKRKMAEVLG